MSSLAEINQRLIEQNNEQERTSVAIEDVRKALITQMKTERRGRLDELEAAKRARPSGGFVSGVGQGIGEASGLGALGRLFTGIMGALFGGGTLAALTTSIGKFIGKGTFIGAAAALVGKFGEDAINALFTELENAGISFGLTNEQQDEIARRGSDVIFAGLITGLVTKNPLVRLATGIVYAFRDHIYTYLEDWFGIKITRFEDGSTQVSIPGLDKTLTPTESQLDLTLAGIATAVSLGVIKLGKSIAAKVKNSLFSAETAATKGFAKIEEDLKRIQADMEADRARTADMQRRLDAQSGSRTTAGQNLSADLQKARTLEEFRALQKINASYTPAPSVSSAAPIQPDSPAVKATNSLASLKDVAIEEAGFSRKVAADGRTLFFDNTGKFAAPQLVLDETLRVQAANKAKTRTAVKVGVGGLVAADLALSGLAGAAQQAEAGKTTRGQLTGGALGGVVTAPAEGFAFLANALASGIEKLAPGYFADKPGERLTFNELTKDISGSVGDQLDKNGILGQEANEKTVQAIITSNDKVSELATAAITNIQNMFDPTKAAENPYASMSQADYLKLASDGFGGSTAPGYSYGSAAPVIVQDNSVKSGGSSSTTINQMNIPVETHDTSWYQRRAAMGRGF